MASPKRKPSNCKNKAKIPSGGKGRNIIQIYNNGKKFQKIGPIESISIYLQIAPIYYVKYRNEESEDKRLRELINEEEVTEVTAKKEERKNMGSVKIEYCFGAEETHKTTRRWKK